MNTPGPLHRLQQYPDNAVAKFTALLDELDRWNRRINLTAVRDRDAMISRHLLDSLSAQPFIRGTRIIDVGTGAGFPGLPLAIVAPEKSFVLLDSNARKVSFVEHVARLLELGNVTAVKARAENYAPGKRFDTVIARAVAALPRLVEIAGHLVGEDGVLLALKGRYPAEEIEALPDQWGSSVKELAVPGLEAGSRHAVIIEHRK